VEQASGFDERPFQLVTNVVELLEVARAEFERDPEAARASITQAARILRSELERREAVANTDSSVGGLAEWQVQRLRAYIDSHLSDTIRIKDLSTIARRSTAHFCHVFKRTFGQTPHAYVMAQRVERAKSLMLKSDDQLCVIAVLCGFADQAHLSKLFRQHTGETPGAWRRRALDDREPPMLAYGEVGALRKAS
jgi:AraC family transcriptional regulator